MSQNQEINDICCPPFNPELWEGKTHVWEKRAFIKDAIRTFLHMPLPSGINKMMMRAWKTIEVAGANPPPDDFIILTKDPSPWRSEYYFSVTRPVEGAQNTTISGTFISKAFDGPYRDVPKFMKLAKHAVEESGHKVKDLYIFYTTCPKCQKKYGHNYMVVFCEI
jgi:hypothetical protein